MRGKIFTCPHRLCFWVVGQVQPEAAVDLQLVFRLGVPQGAHEVAEFFDDRDDLLPVEARRGVGAFSSTGMCWSCFSTLAFGPGFGDPAGDYGRVSAGLECPPGCGPVSRRTQRR